MTKQQWTTKREEEEMRRDSLIRRKCIEDAEGNLIRGYVVAERCGNCGAKSFALASGLPCQFCHGRVRIAIDPASDGVQD